MINKLDTYLAAETSLRATLADFNRQWVAARARCDVRAMREIDRRCNLTEILLAENSAQIDRLRAELESEIDWIEAAADMIDNRRAFALDSGDWLLLLDAEDDLDDLAIDHENAAWDIIFFEHETVWGNTFAPDFS